MKAVIQRVKSSSVMVDNEITGAIEHGLLVLLGIHEDDTDQQLEWICNKISKLRIFEDEEGKMNNSVQDVGGGILIVSQFTLYANSDKGTRPSFIEAARPEKAEPMYNDMIEWFKTNTDLNIQTGEFGAMMSVKLENDGPVTIILEK
ncbi:MAG: D-tyrosyl-tRNA(Tyr) deacylase [Balneola sp.]|jgi:D-tyrosyl-tRNA(Tyr) deacylase|nr:D-tyrosyl-tRNA(Tyr) deacylase [Balneola sp.]MBE77783.1 D-tyrosyl-tRNA(Tyr) deacylase [Balneola sp.]HBX66406.1 D-tyrosyl-tRNA(Tyr) deacylase [Balneolaceae bacterium]|tara:strand:- start:4469 stop:4909 length:441 start_codon:yes stop_codon:yes gene_type:complete